MPLDDCGSCRIKVGLLNGSHLEEMYKGEHGIHWPAHSHKDKAGTFKQGVLTMPDVATLARRTAVDSRQVVCIRHSGGTSTPSSIRSLKMRVSYEWKGRTGIC